MTTQELEARAAAIRADNAGRCKFPGTGYHPNDPTSPQKKGLPGLDQHVVAFRGAWETVFTGDCATRGRGCLADFAAAQAAVLTADRADPEERQVVRTATEYAATPLTADGCFVVRNAQWNDVLKALSLWGVGVTLA